MGRSFFFFFWCVLLKKCTCLIAICSSKPPFSLTLCLSFGEQISRNSTLQRKRKKEQKSIGCWLSANSTVIGSKQKSSVCQFGPILILTKWMRDSNLFDAITSWLIIANKKIIWFEILAKKKFNQSIDRWIRNDERPHTQFSIQQIRFNMYFCNRFNNQN